MQRYDRSSVFPFHFSNICQQYITYVKYARYKWQSNCYWINLENGILIKYMHLNFSKPDISSKQAHIKLIFFNLQPTKFSK